MHTAIVKKEQEEKKEINKLEQNTSGQEGKVLGMYIYFNIFVMLSNSTNGAYKRKIGLNYSQAFPSVLDGQIRCFI